MGWLKKRALLMLALMVTWATVPSLACALPVNQQSQRPTCCRGMGPSCTQMMGMDGSCCEFNHQSPSVEALPPFSPEHTLHLASAAHAFLPLHVQADPAPMTGISVLPAPTTSSGRTTILRI